MQLWVMNLVPLPLKMFLEGYKLGTSPHSNSQLLGSQEEIGPGHTDRFLHATNYVSMHC